MRWVRPELIHLTLRSSWEIRTVPGCRLSAGQWTTPWPGEHEFTLALDSLGCFPNPRRPRVIWAGLGGDTAPLLALKAALDEQLAVLGRPPEDKTFRAHLTLGRVKDERAAQSLSLTAPLPPLAVPVAAIYLMESQLHRRPIYTVRHSAGLSG